MDIIIDEIKLLSIVGLQKKSSLDYRWMTYVVKIPMKDGLLIHNLLTKGLIFVSNAELRIPKITKYLISHWYFVPSKFDDKAFYNQILSLAKMLKHKSNDICTYTIFSTTDCNARCFYCFEKGVRKYHMSKQVSLDVANYIINHCGGNKIRIRWFGGEPLYNFEVIDSISIRLKDEGIEFTSEMVTNGYLFNKEMLTKSVNLWNINRIQITLDGTEKIYNRTKSYIYENEGNPYEKVISNIEMLVNSGICVEIRLNLNSQNIHDLSNLIDELSEKIKNKKCIYIYPRFLYENTGFKDDEKPEIKDRIYKACTELEKKSSDKGFAYKRKIDPRFVINSCMADNDNAIGILPNGDIFKCEHFEGNIIGSIHEESFNKDIVNNCKKKIAEIEECDSCPIYPNCYILDVCVEDVKKCNHYWRQTRLDRLKQEMLNTYNSYLKKQRINEDENDENEIQC